MTAMPPILRDAARRLMMTAYQVSKLRADTPDIQIAQLRERARAVKTYAADMNAAQGFELPREIALLANAAYALAEHRDKPSTFDLLTAAHALCAETLPGRAAQADPQAAEAQPSFWYEQQGLIG